MNQIFNIEGKVAVVTGAGGVLGGCVARSLAHSGVKIALLSRDDTVINPIVDEINAVDGEAIGLKADILSEKILGN